VAHKNKAPPEKNYLGGRSNNLTQHPGPLVCRSGPDPLVKKHSGSTGTHFRAKSNRILRAEIPFFPSTILLPSFLPHIQLSKCTLKVHQKRMDHGQSSPPISSVFHSLEQET
jgi:hypothetical protein